MRRDPSTGQIQSAASEDAVLDFIAEQDLPIATSQMVADEFGFTTQTARNKLTTLVERDDLARIQLDERRHAYAEADYEAAEGILGALRDHIDLADIKTDHLAEFAEEPYCILPKSEQEAFVVVPRFVPFHVGWLDRQTGSYNVFVVNKFVDWIGELPDDIREQVGISAKYDSARVADGELRIDPADRDEAWDEFATDRDQDAIPNDAALKEMDWDRLRSLASRRGVLKQNMSRDDVEAALAAERDDTRIPLKQSREFDVIAQLIEDGNLPFQPSPVDDGDLRAEPEGVTLDDPAAVPSNAAYQTRAWEKLLDTGMVGVYWPPSAGKTFLGLYAGDRLLGEKLVVVPNNTLKEQWQQRIEKFCQHPGEWDIQTYHYIRDNVGSYSPTLTIFDESHHLPANTFAKLATIDTSYRIGLSASPYREDGRTEYIFALTGFPVGLEWQELVSLGVVDTPDAKLRLHEAQQQKRHDVADLVAERPGKILILCDSLDRGERLAEDLDVPFVHGGTTNRMEIFEDNRVVIGSRVADEGLSLQDLDVVIEFDFHGGSRRQETQRYGRVLHGDSEGEHIILMTDQEFQQHSKRLLALEEQGVNVVTERVG